MIVSGRQDKNIKIVFTTDVHGNFFPYNYISLSPAEGGMARVKSAIDSIRMRYGRDSVILLDNGDILQGQPTVYYYNYIDTVSPHIAADIYNFMDYDAITVGNHDVETGHAVYDRVYGQVNVPVLAANVIDIKTAAPYFKPYTVIKRNGLKVAVLGLITPAIPAWLPENLWSGLRFDDMEYTARKWIPEIKRLEQPDIIVGLFHSGHDSSKKTGDYVENASVEIARNVPGFDLVLMGHDHQRYCERITNVAGDTVCVLNPSNNALAIGIADVKLSYDDTGHLIDKKIMASVEDITKHIPSSEFISRFNDCSETVTGFVKRIIGYVSGTMSTEEAFFGPSAFMTLLHKLQLKISGADISFAAPLSFHAEIKAGPLRVSDMFTLYKYENMLYTMELSGQEIKDYLEESYSLWTDQITDHQPHLINFESSSPDMNNNRLRYPSYNFDSAHGIEYTVDITKPKGEKIKILSLSSGKPFDLGAKYMVAINSYRGNGGGNLLTAGAGISPAELKQRIIRSTDKDLRYYLLKTVEADGVIETTTDDNWHFIPESVAETAAALDRVILFSPGTSDNQK